jgi:hypothetical protein
MFFSFLLFIIFFSSLWFAVSRKTPAFLVSGSDDASLKIWDFRKFTSNSAIAHFKFHTAPITSVEWHPQEDSVFAASSADNSISVWDLALERDNDFKPEGAQINDAEYPPQLYFVHQVTAPCPSASPTHSPTPPPLCADSCAGSCVRVCCCRMCVGSNRHQRGALPPAGAGAYAVHCRRRLQHLQTRQYGTHRPATADPQVPPLFACCRLLCLAVSDSEFFSRSQPFKAPNTAAAPAGAAAASAAAAAPAASTASAAAAPTDAKPTA